LERSKGAGMTTTRLWSEAEISEALRQLERAMTDDPAVTVWALYSFLEKLPSYGLSTVPPQS
jgi:hypothetical protein